MNDRLDRQARSGHWLWMLCLLSCGAFADNTTGTLAQFQNPEFMVYLNNALYVADSEKGKIWRISYGDN